MKRYESSRYDTLSLGGNCRLVTRGESLEGIKQEIDDSNARAVAKGYKAESWLITHRESYTYYDDNGMFNRSEELEIAIEVYPPTERSEA